MPNHITNKITFYSDNAAEILAFMKNGESDFDFNKLIPMPESLNIESGSRSAYAFVHAVTDGFKANPIPAQTRKYFGSVLNMFGDWSDNVDRAKSYFDGLDTKEKRAEFIELGKTMLSNYNKYGVGTWYEWAPKNWGTKWNAYQTSVEGNSVVFDTAWDAPKPVIRELMEKFKPDCTQKAFDEGGNFWFIREWRNGVLVGERDSFSEDYRPLSIELKGRDPADDEDEEEAQESGHE